MMIEGYTFKEVLTHFNDKFSGCVIHTPFGLIYSNMNVPAFKSIMMPVSGGLFALQYDVEVFMFVEKKLGYVFDIPVIAYMKTDTTILGHVSGYHLITKLEERIKYVMETDESQIHYLYIGCLNDTQQIVTRIQASRFDESEGKWIVKT